ncbi:MAG: aldehyde ferredoxin oxidoreductase family protein [Promethearchaeia archaeon]
MTPYKGMTGKLLRVNLSTQETVVEAIQPDLYENFLGGRGLGAYYLFREVPPKVGGLSLQNKLIFMNGPLAGTLIPGNNKFCLSFKSPLTHTYSYSLCGGHYGPALKFAGYDGLIIEEKATQPVFLWIDDEDIQILPANKIWGDNIPSAEEKIRDELGGDKSIKTACIGPAGEKLVRYACITSSRYREFGRGGSGAVMGSKNLKAIAIRGTQDVRVAKPDKVVELSKRLINNLRNSGGGKVRRQYGTPELVERINGAGFWVTRNFQEGFFEDGDKLEAEIMREQIVVGDASCFGCPIACGKRTAITTQEGKKYLMEGPEFETIGMLGSNCGISDWETLLKATDICDRCGFDTINGGACVSMAMEAYEKGKITDKDTGGLKLEFGNKKALLTLLTQICHREGLGDILAEGVAAAAEKLGTEELAIHSKGQSFPVYDPRGAKAMALTYATSPKGAHHMLATTFGNELAMGNRFEIKGKGQLEREHQFSMAVVDSIALCSTMRAGFTLADQAEAYSAVTGMQVDVDYLNRAAERIINLERMYNVKLGLDRKDDTLPKRFLEEPMPKGPSKGQKVELDALLDQYYDIMGWSSNGIPTDQKLTELDLNDLIDM